MALPFLDGSVFVRAQERQAALGQSRRYSFSPMWYLLKAWMAGHRLAEATPSFERLRPAARATAFRLERIRERGGFCQTATMMSGRASARRRSATHLQVSLSLRARFRIEGAGGP